MSNVCKQIFNYERIKKQLPLTPKRREKRLKFVSKHIVEIKGFKQMFFTDENRFCFDEPDNISSCIKHRGDGIIASHRVKRQMGGVGTVILGAIFSFGNLVIKIIEGKYNSLKYLADLRTTFINLAAKQCEYPHLEKKWWST